MHKILLVADTHPDRSSGYGIRLLHVIEALDSIGEVDVVTIDNADLIDRHAGSVPPHAARYLQLARTDDRRGVVRDVWRWARSGSPRRIAWQDWTEALASLRRWMRDDYDLVWLSHADVGARLLPLFGSTPTIVDLDNLEDEKLRRRQEARAYRVSDHGLLAAAHYVLDRFDVGRWQRLQRGLAATADHVVVCSALDKARLAVDGSVVVPNGYDALPPARRPARDDPPVLTYISLLRYEPNLDAAEVLAFDVLPRVRRRRPDVQLRLVGRHHPEARRLETSPGTTLVGYVEHVADELARADVIVAPIRFGSGTRVKILEAFAAEVPVVTTAVGCEGLDVQPGVHLLVADTVDDFAEAVCSLLDDPALAGRLSCAARELWASNYSGERIRRVISSLARDALREPR